MKNRLTKVFVALIAMVALSSCSSEMWYKFKTACNSNPSTEAVITVDTNSSVQWSAIALPYKTIQDEGFTDPIKDRYSVIEYVLRKYAGKVEVSSGPGTATFKASELKAMGDTHWVLYVFRYQHGYNNKSTYVDAYQYQIY